MTTEYTDSEDIDFFGGFGLWFPEEDDHIDYEHFEPQEEE